MPNRKFRKLNTQKSPRVIVWLPFGVGCQFKNGIYETENQKEAEWLKAHGYEELGGEMNAAPEETEIEIGTGSGLKDMTVAQLKEACIASGLNFSKKARKAELLELLEKGTGE